MPVLSDISLPPNLSLTRAEPCADGETNEVYSCDVTERGAEVRSYLKINKHANLSLRNERAVLEQLAGGPLPVPRVMAFVESPREALLTQALPGRMIWDFIDPRRTPYAPDAVPQLLEEYGACLARIHALPITWQPQVRQFLYRLEPKDLAEGPEFREVLDWVEAHSLYQSRDFESVFVHGDLNIGSVLIEGGKVSGVVDWEFAGSGWREYDLAWILRARTAFLNTPEEREAILRGYRRLANFDPEALQLAEVMNYLRFTKWTPTEAGRVFFLGRARLAMMG